MFRPFQDMGERCFAPTVKQQLKNDLKMYYITKRDSETGKKFQKVFEKIKECNHFQNEMAEKYGFDGWRKAPFCATGGISLVKFPEQSDVDDKAWKKENGLYSPRKNTKEGKQIYKEFSKAPTLSVLELNECIGWKETFKSIGVNFNNDDYIGFVTEEKWDCPIPDDCEEVTYLCYVNYFYED